MCEDMNHSDREKFKFTVKVPRRLSGDFSSQTSAVV